MRFGDLHAKHSAGFLKRNIVQGTTRRYTALWASGSFGYWFSGMGLPETNRSDPKGTRVIEHESMYSCQ